LNSGAYPEREVTQKMLPFSLVALWLELAWPEYATDEDASYPAAPHVSEAGPR
jgi:hypothetical protein